MEERIIDRDKRVTLKVTRDGAVDAVEGETAEQEEEEVSFDFPEEETYDDDLVGLTPSQLEDRMRAKKRAEERAREEYAKLMEEGLRLLGEAEYEQAEPLFAQAAIYGCDDGTARKNLWLVRTKNYTTAEALYDEETAREFAASEDEVKAETLSRLGGELKAERARCLAEAEPIRNRYEAKKAERSEAFDANKRYYAVRFFSVLAVFVLLGIACAVSGAYILRVKDNVPLILTVCFAVLTFAAFFAVVYFARKFSVARRYVRENEDPTSTEDGARLNELETRIARISRILGE